MKFIYFIFALLLSIVSNIFSKQFNLLKQKRKEGFFIFEGKTYKQDEIKFTSYIANCFIIFNSSIYDLNGLSSYGPFSLNTKQGSKIDFDICKNYDSLCNDKRSMININSTSDTNCKLLSKSWIHDKVWTWDSLYKFNVEFPEGDICNNKTQEKFKISMSFKCNPDVKSLRIINENSFDEKACKNNILVETKESCPKYLFSSWWNILPINEFVAVAVLLFIGSFMLIFGNKYFNNVFAVIIIILWGAISVKSILMALSIGIIIAGIAYFFLTIIPRLLFYFLGTFLGNCLYSVLLYHFPHFNPVITYYACLSVCIIFAEVFLCFIAVVMNIIVTSFIGAYFIVRAVSIIFGGFPDETYTSILIEKFEFGQLRVLFGGIIIVYLISFIVLFVTGMIVQFWIRSPPSVKT